ncbi:hypothetical protein F5Y12DRAFT_719702 [Xylaria sp. FL1777]|nr:hypothetical protein F5Y12DRAFT_719702 [Xylaria sp. FL1777]
MSSIGKKIRIEQAPSTSNPSPSPISLHRGSKTSFSTPTESTTSILAKALAKIAESSGSSVVRIADDTILTNDCLLSIFQSLGEGLSRNIGVNDFLRQCTTFGQLKKFLHEGRSSTSGPTKTDIAKSTRTNSRNEPMVHASSQIQEKDNGRWRRSRDPLDHTNPTANREKVGHRRTFLESLDFPQTGAHKIIVKKEHAEGCLWFLETPQYLDWIDANKLGNHYGVLWIKGKPGSGKSTLMRFMLSHSRRFMKGTTIISFFFNFGGYELQKSTTGLYRSLLLQLLQERPDLQSILDTASIELPWSVEALQVLFSEAIKNFGKASLTCFIDALDECEESQIEKMLRFLGDICQRAASSETTLRICLASRHYPSLKMLGLEFTLEAYGHSIVNYIEQTLKIGHDDITDSIHFEVQKRASGNFKWATLVVDWLNKEYAKGCDLDSLYLTLCQFPTDHNKLSEIMSPYKGKQRRRVLPVASTILISETSSEFLNTEDSKEFRRSKPKVKLGCSNCRRRKIKCDGKKPACSQCVRMWKECNGSQPLLTKTVEERPTQESSFATPPPASTPPLAKHAANSTAGNTLHQPPKRRTDVDPSPSDSGYATVSYGSRAQINQSENDNDNDSEEDDMLTVYTELASHPDVRTESYIETFANDLFTKIGGKQLSARMIQKLSDSLPTLLKALALTIGYQNQTQVQRDLMVFIHKQREAITRSFKNHYDNAKDLDSEMTLIREPKPTEIMERWLASKDESKFEKFDTEPPEDNTESSSQEECSDSPQLSIPELEEYRKILVEDPSYMWMLARLRRDLILSTVHYDILNQIMGAIQSEFPQTRNVSRKKSPEEVQVTFTVDWDIIGFICQQGYDAPHSEALANSVTLTGTHTHAQALTCRQYMAQMWPLTGLQTLKLIQETLKTTERKKKLFFSTPCRLTLEASITNGSSMIVTASGLPYFIAEIGEQLAWLGSALRPFLPSAVRPSFANAGVYICTPYLMARDDAPSNVRFHIKYNIKLCDSPKQNPNGRCWSYLFSNPVIAGGFPILHRQEPDTGLEMPLELMVALTGTRYLDTYNSNTYIKGFNTMLVPTKQSEDLVVWHLLCSRNPSKRISYLLSDIEPVSITKTGLEKSRHVLGWCADATSIVGTTQATYDIGRSRLPKARSHHMLEKVEITAGQFVTGTAAFTLGNREKPVHISRFGFLTKLQWISSKYMVLWDEADKRGWLVNGASVLLHILRASLAHSKRKFQSAWLLEPDALKDAPDLTRPDASLQVLIDENNRNLTLYMDKTEVYEENVREGATTNSSSRRQTRHYRLEDRIEHIYNILEKLIDHQTDVERRSGVQISIRPRRQLEGWDFKDLVKDGDPIFPRAATLPTVGKGWVDFTRAIHAVTLFGRGFGELIQPRQPDPSTTSLCSRWSRLPKESYYLAACVSNLLEIMEEDGDAAANPRRLCDNVIWHMKRATFDPCPCTTKDAKQGHHHHHHHDPVQALFPLKFTGGLRKKPQVDLEGAGAVIFGHNMSLHWHWPDSGDPVKGDPPPEEWSVAADSFEDSGIGSSLSSSRFLSTSDPDSAGSTGDKSPIQSQLIMPASPPETPARGTKRALRGIVSSVSKKMKR